MASRELNMEDEANRLSTYEDWPNSNVQPSDLAACGFFYTDVGDLVKCFKCGVEVGGWQRGDDPLIEHENWQPDCPFIYTYLTENLPIPECLAHYHHVPHSCPHHNKMNKKIALKMKIIEKSFEKLKIYETGPPVHVMFSSAESRLQTFKTWPIGMKMEARKLCEAGFFYTGNDDTTLCFHCGKDVCDWTANEDPWAQHALFSPKCSYVLLNKGIAFVDNVFKRRGNQKSKKDFKYLQLPETLKGMIDIRNHVHSSSSRSATKSEATADPSNQEASGLGESVRSTNGSVETENSANEDIASSHSYGFKGIVGKELAGCKISRSKGSKAMISKGFMCQKEHFNVSKIVNEMNDTVTIKRSDSKERNGATLKKDYIAHDCLCRICFQEPLGAAILPCGHLVTCINCASSLKECTVCFEHCVATGKCSIPSLPGMHATVHKVTISVTEVPYLVPKSYWLSFQVLLCTNSVHNSTVASSAHRYGLL